MLLGKKLVALLILTIVLIVPACSDDDDPVIPTMTGTWDVEWYMGEFLVLATWNLTQNDVNLEGTMNIDGSIYDLSGTCSANGDVSMGWTSSGNTYHIEGTVSEARTTFDGGFTLPEILSTDSLSARKR